jgi:hypothetical protein
MCIGYSHLGVGTQFSNFAVDLALKLACNAVQFDFLIAKEFNLHASILLNSYFFVITYRFCEDSVLLNTVL